jgi:hypothetical protein
VAKEDFPIFAVEYDGRNHISDPAAIEKDIIKNRLCKLADLPLLRIMTTEIELRDKIALLDYMLARYLAWPKEIDEITGQIDECASVASPDADPAALAVDLDPNFQFDLRHPFPASESLREQLWKDYALASDDADNPRHSSARLLYQVCPTRCGSLQRDQFHTCEAAVRVWDPKSAMKFVVFSDSVSVTVRHWLPLRRDIPSAEVPLSDIIASASGINELLERAKIRKESMWFPRLPGIHPYDISENYVRYLGLRAIERWAKKSRLA